MNRRLAVRGALLVGCIALVSVAFTAGAAAAQHEIDSCTVIDEPGEYELVDDVDTDEEATCIEIRAPNVTLDGNDHTVTGPGPGDPQGAVAGIEVNQSVDDTGTVLVRNVEVEGFEYGVYGRDGGPLVVVDAVVRGNRRGVEVEEFGDVTLRDTTLADNEQAGYTGIAQGDVTFTNVTVEGNGDPGVFLSEISSAEVTSTTVRDNGGTGVVINFPGTGATLTDVTVTGNDGVGILTLSGGPVTVDASEVTDNGDSGIVLEDGGEVGDSLVEDNGGHGVHLEGDAALEDLEVRGNADHGVLSYSPLRLTDVRLIDNGGNELNAFDGQNEGNVTAEDLEVGPSATLAFERQAVTLEPVDRDALPDREDGTAVGDGLNVTGNVTGPIDLELDVESDDDTVDLWRHDGTEWETVEEDLPVTDGAIAASVDRDGTYAPGTAADDTEPEPTPTDEDGEKETDIPTSTPSDQDGAKKKTATPSDQDGEKKDKHTETPTDSDGSSCGCSGSAGSPDGQEATDSPTPSPANESTPEDDEQQQIDGDDDAVDDESNDDSTLGDGPGFTGVAALVALLASALLLQRRQ